METSVTNVRPTSAKATAAPIEALMVRVGKRDFALPLEDVEYIVPLPPDFAHSGECAEKYLNHQGVPLDFVSSWDLSGEASCYSEFAELATMLPQRRRDHTDWMSALENSLRNGCAFAKARDPHECAFGKWYYAYQPSDRRLALLLRGFEQPHAMIHSLADRLLKLSEAGKREEALARFQEERETTLKDLLRLFDRTGAVLQSLQRRVAIILRRGDMRCALGADRVTDIVSVPADRVSHHTDAARHHNQSSLLLILENGGICAMINWKAFSRTASKLFPR